MNSHVTYLQYESGHTDLSVNFMAWVNQNLIDSDHWHEYITCFYCMSCLIDGPVKSLLKNEVHHHYKAVTGL